MNRNIKAVLGLITVMAAGGCEREEARTADTDAAHAGIGQIENPSVTVHPVVLAGQPSERVSEVVGIFLERGGIETVELSPRVFEPDPGQGIDEQAAAFGAFVADAHPATDYSLFASYTATPATGFEEVRGIIVDAEGTVLWKDRQRQGDEAFDRVDPGGPMDCCILLAERLRGPLGLDDPMREDAPEGALARRLRERSGVPTDEEFAGIQGRAETLRDGHSDKSLLVYPARIGDEYCAVCAEQLAAAINERGLMRATAADAPLPFSAVRDMNEQKVLWTGARSVQALIRENPPDVDYVMAVDFLMDPAGGDVGGVHTFVLESDGDWAIVDFQNSHHPDFQRIKPHGRDGCCDLAVARLAGYLD
jgi:hypothetical protein